MCMNNEMLFESLSVLHSFINYLYFLDISLKLGLFCIKTNFAWQLILGQLQ